MRGGIGFGVGGGGGSKKIVRWGDTPATTAPPTMGNPGIRYYNNAHGTSTVFLKNY